MSGIKRPRLASDINSNTDGRRRTGTTSINLETVVNAAAASGIAGGM